MHAIVVPSRRRKREEVEEAWAFAAEKRKDVDAFWKRLTDPQTVTRLPYPGGVSYPGRRPGYSFNFIGNPNVQKVLDAWNQQDEYTRAFYVVGAKGVGKSSVMRAFAWLLFVSEPENLKLVCIWNMTYARQAFLQYVKDALYFSYFKDNDALCQIEHMLSLSDVQLFLSSREEKGEVIVFLLDAAQAADLVHRDTRPRNDDDGSSIATRTWMAQMFRDRPVIWVLSPAAEKTIEFEEKFMDDICVIHFNTGFVGDAMNGFMSHAILGLLIEKRGRDISHYAGKHPLLLFALEECCRKVAADKMNMGPKDVQREDAATLLEEDEDWEDVINAFIDHGYVASIQVDIDRHLKLKEGETYHTVEKMISCDPRYALTMNQFCSPYIERMYIEAFRAKEQATSLNDSSPWVAYGEMLLSQPFMNRLDLGWLCERLCADVVSRLGIDIGAKPSIGKLTLKRIRKVPCVDSELVPGHGVLYLPVTFSFGHVDAIIIYKGVDGRLHFIGLQITTSLKQHMQSENEFMSYEVLKEWNVLDGVWNLHYAFVCLTEAEWSLEKKENLTRLRRDVIIGIVGHSLHVISFETALGNRTGKRTLDVLKKMTQLREGKLAPPPPKEDGALSLAKLKQRELDAIARDVMIDPNMYKKKDDLIAALRSKSIKSQSEQQ